MDRGYDETQLVFMTLTELMNDSNFTNLSERILNSKPARERDNLLAAKSLIDELTSIYNLFGATTTIHMKFANLQLYVIKRLNQLVYNIEDYNPLGGGKNLMYQSQYWNDSLPSDPELISCIFCHLLDIAYYGSVPRTDYRNAISHLITSNQVNSINYLSEE